MERSRDIERAAERACAADRAIPPLHVAQYTDSYPPIIDGVAYTALNYAKHLNRMGNRCCVVAPRVPGYVDEAEFPVYRFAACPIALRPPYRFAMPVLDVALHRRMRGLPLSLVHAHSPFGSGSEALRVARKYDVPLVASFHSKYWDDFYEATHSEFLADRVVGRIVRFYRRADSVWAVSDRTADTLRDYGYDGPIVVMPNGHDMRPTADTLRLARELAERWHLPEGESVFLFVGQMVWQKNLRLLLEAFARYRDAYGEGQLLLVGGGGVQGEIRALAARLGVADSVRFPGVIYEREVLAAAYARSDLFLFPSRYDNAPLVVREAAAMGCPSLMLRGSHASQGAVDGVNAFLCEESPDAMAAAMRDAVADPDRLAAVGREARRTLAQPWEGIVRDVEAKYREILSAREGADGREARRGTGPA